LRSDIPDAARKPCGKILALLALLFSKSFFACGISLRPHNLLSRAEEMPAALDPCGRGSQGFQILAAFVEK
jgi:hypothetical protein